MRFTTEDKYFISCEWLRDEAKHSLKLFANGGWSLGVRHFQANQWEIFDFVARSLQSVRAVCGRPRPPQCEHNVNATTSVNVLTTKIQSSVRIHLKRFTAAM